MRSMAQNGQRFTGDSSRFAVMNGILAERTVAILVADGFEQIEMAGPKAALEAAGARTCVVAPRRGAVIAWHHDRLGDRFPVDRALGEVDEREFDALLLPGEVLNPGTLRGSRPAVDFVRGFFAASKPVAAMALGLRAVIEAGVVGKRTVTSFPSVRAELIRAGANWVDAAVVVDHGLVTCRSAAELELFNAMMVEAFAHGPAHVGFERNHHNPVVARS
jgi:protease I